MSVARLGHSDISLRIVHYKDGSKRAELWNPNDIIDEGEARAIIKLMNKRLQDFA